MKSLAQRLQLKELAARRVKLEEFSSKSACGSKSLARRLCDVARRAWLEDCAQLKESSSKGEARRVYVAQRVCSSKSLARRV